MSKIFDTQGGWFPKLGVEAGRKI